MLIMKPTETSSSTPDTAQGIVAHSRFTYGTRTMTTVRPCGRSRRTFVDGRIGCFTPIAAVRQTFWDAGTSYSRNHIDVCWPANGSHHSAVSAATEKSAAPIRFKSRDPGSGRQFKAFEH